MNSLKCILNCSICDNNKMCIVDMKNYIESKYTYTVDNILEFYRDYFLVGYYIPETARDVIVKFMDLLNKIIVEEELI